MHKVRNNESGGDKFELQIRSLLRMSYDELWLAKNDHVNMT